MGRKSRPGIGRLNLGQVSTVSFLGIYLRFAGGPHTVCNTARCFNTGSDGKLRFAVYVQTTQIAHYAGIEESRERAIFHVNTIPAMRRPRGTGSLFRRPRSPFWWIQYYRDGRCYRESSHTTSESQARRLLQRKLAEAASDTFVAPRTARVRVDELAEDFLRDQAIHERKARSDADTRWNLHLNPVFGHLRAISVGTDQISRYIQMRKEQGAKNGTINRDIACLKRMFNLGAQATPPKVARVPKFPHLVENNVREGFLDDAGYQALAQAAGAVGLWLRTLLEVAYLYGWRLSELLNLKVRQVDLLGRTLRLQSGTTKNGDGRIVVMTDHVHQLLTQSVSDKKPDDFVFTRDKGRPVREFRGTWTFIRNQAGKPNLLFHDLRRTAVRNMVRAGVPERVAMQISGHKTRQIFDRYHIVSENDLREAAHKLENRSSGDQAIVRSQPSELLGVH